VGEREKIGSGEELKKAALNKKVRAANRSYLGERLLDVIIALGITGCVLVGYYRHVWLAVLLLICVLTFARWRWRHWSDEWIDAESDVWNDDSSADATDNGRFDSVDSSDSSDAGGGD
jgi:hypothetical protein